MNISEKKFWLKELAKYGIEKRLIGIAIRQEYKKCCLGKVDLK